MRKSKIIKMALLELGFPYSEADNKEAEEVKAASFLFETALDILFTEDSFTFNIKSIEPTKTERAEHMGKTEYVKPKNYLCSMTPGIEEKRDRLLSRNPIKCLTFKESIDLQDVPKKYDRLLSLILSELVCSTANKQKALPRILQLKDDEISRLWELDSFDMEMEDLI